VAYLAVALGAVAIAGLHIAEHPKLSPVDEMAHLDYSYRVSHGHLVRRGDVVGDEAVRAAACRGIDTILDPYVLPPCDDPSAYPPEANISYMHPPLYYAVTGTAARVIAGAGVASFVTAARIANGMWFASGIVLMFLLLGEVGVAGVARVAGAFLPALAPFVLFQSATVTNDVTAVPTAAAVMFLACRAERGRTRYALALACALSMWLRMTNVFGIAVAVGYLVVRAVRTREPERRRTLLGAAAIATAATVLAGLAWLVVLSAIARVDSIPFAQTVPKRFEFDRLLQSIPEIVPPTQELPPVPFWSDSALAAVVCGLIGWLVIAGPMMALARHGARGADLDEPDRPLGVDLAALGLATAAVLLAIGPTLIVINSVSHDSLILPPLPRRFGLSMLPACFTAALAGARSVWASRALAVFVGGGLLVMVATIA
jgi:hypothetical protein